MMTSVKGKSKTRNVVKGAKGGGRPRNLRTEEIFHLISDEVLSAFPEPILLHAADGRIIFVNPPAIESLGFDPTGISRDELRDRISPPGRDGSKMNESDLFSSAQPCDGTTRSAIYKFRDAGGETKITIASCAPIVYSGSTIGMIVTWHDITEQAGREELVILDRDALEDLLVERTCALMKSRELLERQKRLSEIGTLAATIAHELRNPLGVIRTAAYNIRRKNDDPRLNRHLANIDKKIEESALIINNILSYSRHNYPVALPVRLTELLVDCVDSTRKKYRKSPVRISARLAGIKDLVIEADAGQLKEVFLNILNNSIEAIEGEGLVRVRARSRDSESVQVMIADTGAGISEDALERIFDPFYSNKARGTGLGLAVCRKIVDLHNGEIEVRSVPGEGTEVTVSLPLKGDPSENRKKDTDRRG